MGDDWVEEITGVGLILSGTVVSIVQVYDAGLASVLPNVSVALT